MHGFVSKYGMQHALGDCYCDDWAIEDDLPGNSALKTCPFCDGSVTRDGLESPGAFPRICSLSVGCFPQIDSCLFVDGGFYWTLQSRFFFEKLSWLVNLPPPNVPPQK